MASPRSTSPTSLPHPSTSVDQVIDSSSSRHHTNLPSPPPADRVPPPKGRPPPKFKILRKGKDRERLDSTALEDDWTLEGVSANVNEDDDVDVDRRESIDCRRAVDEKRVPQAYDIVVKDEERKEKKSKGRQLAKKTSRLFGRDKDKDRPELDTTFTSSSSSANPSRQSSSTSADTQSITSRHMSTSFLARQSSIQARARSPRDGFQAHSRRASQDSQTSWQALKSGRSFVSHDRATESASAGGPGLPIPQRQGASVSALSRYSLPQPIGNNSRSPDTLPTKMSTWFSHLLPTSETQSAPSDATSPIRKQPSVAASLFNAARQKAVDGVRHLLDSEAIPDKCADTIWVRGVGHPGWRPATPDTASSPLPSLDSAEDTRSSVSGSRPSPTGFRPSSWRRAASLTPAMPQPQLPGGSASHPSVTSPNKGFTNIWNSSTLSLALPGGSPSKEKERGDGRDSPGKKKGKDVAKWPDQFYEDFKSTVWCTYRSQYAPILSLAPSLLIPSPEAYYASFGPPLDATAVMPQGTQGPQEVPSSPQQTTAAGPASWWGKDERGLTSDAGWGCMLRTGQSLLVNALVHVHLGRDWRLPPLPPTNSSMTAADVEELKAYAKYVQILSWFFDDPSPACPFSVHRMALIGKELGKEVGEWFGPSTASGALKTLANSFAPSGVSVATATDSIIYKSDVYAASRLPSDSWEKAHPSLATFASVKKERKQSGDGGGSEWGEKAVLILVGVRLGLDGVNPIYYDSIKALFAFPQSVGIAGGRPSSSYYFIGTQANSLFYLDPHLTRPAIPLQTPPLPSLPADLPSTPRPSATSDNAASHNNPVKDATGHRRAYDTDNVYSPLTSSTSHSSSMSEHPHPELVKYKLDVVDVDDVSEDNSEDSLREESSPEERKRTARKERAFRQSQNTDRRQHHSPFQSPTKQASSARPIPLVDSVHSSTTSTSQLPETQIDPVAQWYATAYPPSSLRTFHCEKVKKMPYSSLDPSMLLGFICKDEADFEDFVERVGKLPKKIFTVQDEQPVWEEDDDVGIESVSEPDFDDEAEAETEVEQPGTARPILYGTGSPVAESEIGGPSVTSASAEEPDFPGEEVRDDDDLDSLGDEGSIGTTVGAVDIARHVRNIDLAKDDDEAEWISGTPSSLGVLVETPSSLQNTPSKSQLDPKEEEVEDIAQEGKRLWPLRNRMESWVEPSPGGQEAPNGDSLL